MEQFKLAFEPSEIISFKISIDGGNTWKEATCVCSKDVITIKSDYKTTQQLSVQKCLAADYLIRSSKT